MTLRPLLDAAPPIPVHVLVAVLVAVLGLWQLTATKGTRRHRIVGWVYAVAISFVAISALFISELETWGHFSPIHLLIPVTLVSVWLSVRDARRGNIEAHARGMVILFVLAVALTGAFTLMPGRVMHEAVFGVETDGGLQ